MDPADLVRYYTLSEGDVILIRQRRRATNRMGFAVQLCLARFPGRILRLGEQLPRPLLEFIAEQTGTRWQDFEDYASRDQTRREHVSVLIAELGLTTFTGHDFRKVARWLVPVAVENPKSVFLVGAVLNELRHRRILHPPLAVVERLVATTEANADRRVFDLINDRLTDEHRQNLDQWLGIVEGENQSRFSWIRQPTGRPCPANVIKILERLDLIRKLKFPASLTEYLPPSRRESLAGEGRRIVVQNLRKFSDSRRYAVMAVSLIETHRSLVDEAINMHDGIVGRLFRKSKRRHADQLQSESARIKKAIDIFATIGKVLVQAKETNADAWQAIDEVIPWPELRATVEDIQDLSGPRKLHHLHFIDSHYSQIRRYAPALLEHFDFQAAQAGGDVLAAIEILRKLNTAGERGLPDGVPTSFISNQWEPFVYQEGEINRRYYELCTLSELRNRLRSGDIWVPGSRQYQDFEGYLLGKTAFKELQESNELPVAVETDCSRYLAERKALLGERLEEVHSLAKDNALEGVEIKADGFSIKPYRSSGVPDEAATFVQEVHAKLPRIKITDLLVEVNAWTRFADQFTHLRTGLPTEEKQGLLTVILSDAINLGLTRMAEASKGSSYKQLCSIADWHVRSECYDRALADVVNYHHRTELVESWGDGTTSSSDGQQFPLGHAAKPLGHVNPKYGSHPGVIFYTHISDQYSPFHTKLINTNTRDATYVLDGLLYHECNLAIEEHYTDTAGFTDHVFGLCHLLGFRFAPRIRGVGSLSLFPIEQPDRWPELATVFGSRIRTHEIEGQWDDILRLASSIRLGTVTASLIIRKLASYPRQNRLALAMRELGRIERTLFILDWMQNPSLRARVQAGLNKGEARNALARAVFFNRLGEVRDRSFENQCYRASGLNLVVAAIILWNTVHLEKAVAEVRERQEVPDDYLSYLSPLGWDHINLTGDYTWNLNGP